MAAASDVCATCSEHFDDLKCAVKCNSCENYFHGACEGLKTLQGFHMKRATWKCGKCDPPSENPHRKRFRSCNSDIIEIDRNDLAELLATVKDLTSTVESMKIQLSDVQEQNKSLTSLLSSFIDKQSSITTTTSYAAAVNKKPRSNVNNKSTRSNSISAEVAERNASRAENSQAEKMDTDISNNETPFTEVRRRKKSLRKPVFIGSAEPSAGPADAPSTVTFSGIERRQWVYVGRVAVGTTTDTIIDHVKSTWSIPDVKCVQLASNDEICSFKVGVKESMIPSLLDPSKWPKLVAVREFVQFPRRNQAANFPTSSQKPHNP